MIHNDYFFSTYAVTALRDHHPILRLKKTSKIATAATTPTAATPTATTKAAKK